jgi:hypothetical protein
MERAHNISHFRRVLFHQLLRLRNKAIHHPTTLTEKDFEAARKNLQLLEEAL